MTACSPAAPSDAALHEAANAAVLHRDVTSRADQVGLLQPGHPLLRRVFGEIQAASSAGRCAVDTSRNDLPHARLRSGSAAATKVGNDRQDLQRHVVGEFLEALQQRGVRELELAVGAQVLRRHNRSFLAAVGSIAEKLT